MSWYERPYAGGGGDGGFRLPDNPMNWAPRIGRVWGIRVRVHLLFILYILYRLVQARESFPFTAQYLLIVFGCVFLHELGHCFAARRVGGSADEILMWPLGGLAMVDAPRTPWAQFVTVVWGPLVNVAIVVASWSALRVSLGGHAAPSLNPFAPGYALGPAWTSGWQWLNLLFHVNYWMALFNLLCPMYPMDSGRLLQCALWPRLGLARSMMVTTFVGMVAAIALGFLAVARRDNVDFLMLTLAMMGYMTCMQERQMLKAGMMTDDNVAGYDFSGGYTSVEGPRRREGWLARWRRKRTETRRKQAANQAANEQIEVDRILAKVHDHGLQSLTRAERRTLETATRRQRDRESPVH